MKSEKTPRLIAISGPADRNTYLIGPDGHTIGRDPRNTVCLDDETLSDFHLEIFYKNGLTKVVDRNALNGIWINGEAHLEKVLIQGDRIKCGVMTFLYWEDEEDPDLTLIVVEARARNQRLETLRVDYRSRDELTAFYRKLNNVLLGLVEMLQSIYDVQQIQARVLECAFEVIPTYRAAIFLNGSLVSPDHFASRFYRERESGKATYFLENGKLVRRVYQDRSGHFDNEIPAICSPLIFKWAIGGVIYMEGGERGAVFEPEDLHYLSGIAGVLVTALKLSGDIEANREKREILQAQVPDVERKIIGESQAMQHIFREIKRAAATDSPVLITGESGTGKELVARDIHAQSSRRDKPFVALNCAGLSDGTVQSELFGHEKGAFTGAIGSRKGRILLAEGGTLFLDEIGDLKMEMQGLLLRFLQEGTFEPLGSDKTIRANVRIIAATNVDLPKAIAEGEFRQDLYYRLNVFPISVPALRERTRDIALLANYFMQRYGVPRGFTDISQRAVDGLTIHSWPGNVRELESTIRYAVDHGDPPSIEAAALLTHLTKTLEHVEKFGGPTDEMKRIQAEYVLKQAGGDKEAAAKMLDISLSQLYRRLNPDSK